MSGPPLAKRCRGPQAEGRRVRKMTSYEGLLIAKMAGIKYDPAVRYAIAVYPTSKDSDVYTETYAKFSSFLDNVRVDKTSDRLRVTQIEEEPAVFEVVAGDDYVNPMDSDVEIRQIMELLFRVRSIANELYSPSIDIGFRVEELE